MIKQYCFLTDNFKQDYLTNMIKPKTIPLTSLIFNILDKLHSVLFFYFF